MGSSVSIKAWVWALSLKRDCLEFISLGKGKSRG